MVNFNERKVLAENNSVILKIVCTHAANTGEMLNVTTFWYHIKDKIWVTNSFERQYSMCMYKKHPWKTLLHGCIRCIKPEMSVSFISCLLLGLSNCFKDYRYKTTKNSKNSFGE